MEIAVILTCHNRKEKTLTCLESLYKALDCYNDENQIKICLTPYITDDGCTDGTAEAILNLYSEKQIHIVKGNGSLFWAGGMRLAWREALKLGNVYDFYLLLNDDTVVYNNCFFELLQTNIYSLNYFKKHGLYSGITCNISDHQKISYGGSIWTNRLLAKSKMLKPSGTPQLCDMTNANILLVSKEVVDEIGILYEGFCHATADYDYSINARKKNIPVLVTANVCGECDDDHGTFEENGHKICAMGLKERISYFQHPLHSNKDYLLYIRRNTPFRYPIVWLGRFVNLYFPRIYYNLFRR